jgi:hypothetical protein
LAGVIAATSEALGRRTQSQAEAIAVISAVVAISAAMAEVSAIALRLFLPGEEAVEIAGSTIQLTAEVLPIATARLLTVLVAQPVATRSLTARPAHDSNSIARGATYRVLEEAIEAELA